MLDRVVEIAKKKLTGYEYEIFFMKNRKLRSESQDLRVDKLIASEDVGFSVRVTNGRKQGFSYSTVFDTKSIEETIERAKDLCDVVSEEETIVLKDRLEKAEEIEYYDLFATKLPVEEKIEKSIELERLVKQMDDRIKAVRNSTFIENIFEKHLINSFGLEVREIGTVYTAMVSAVAREGEDSQIAWSYNSKRFLSDLDLEEIAREAVFNSTSLLGAGSIKTKSMLVLFPPPSIVELLDTFSPAFLGDNLIKGKTLFKDKVDQKVAFEKITLIDNGLLSKGLASSSYDGDGVAKRKTVVIENGYFKVFLHNLNTAKKANSQSTGNSSRNDFRTFPSVSITNFYIERSDDDIQKIIQDKDEVFYVIDMMGLHTADPISGDFSLGVNGLIISRGEIVRGVRGATIAGNFLELLQKTVAVGRDLKFYANIGSPSVLIEGITIAGD